MCPRSFLLPAGQFSHQVFTLSVNYSRDYSESCQAKISYLKSALGVKISCYNKSMKHELMEILVCPVCKGKLDLEVTEEGAGEIINGSLFCAACQVKYPIENRIPNLLPPTAKS